MPLTNASGDPANDYLVIGIAESLVTRLAALPNVAVLSRAAVSDARRTATDVQSLVNALDASFIVYGTVQQNDAQLRISLSLMRPNGTVIWADSVEGPFNSIFSLQTQLASALTNALSIQSSAAQRASLARQPTMNPEALALYWQGRALLERRDITGNVERALMAFDAAIRVDPRFADAHAGRGEALWAKYLEKRDSVFAYDAISAGNEALRLAPDRPHVRYSLALALEGTGRSNEAIEELDRALALQPNYDDARRRLAQVLARQGRLDDAIAQFQKAIDIRPNYWGNYSALGVDLFRAARYREALEAFRQVARLQPDSPSGLQQMGATYQQLGDLDAALEHFRKANAIAPLPQSYSGIGAVLHQKGDYQGAVDAYTVSLELRPNSHITKRNLGDALRRLGRSSAATTAYREAAALVDAELKINPRDSLLLAFLAVYLAKVGDPRAIERIREARLLSPTDVQVVYRSAVVNALAGRQSEALADLGEALKLGYPATFAAADDDFDAFRHLPQFQQLVKR
jgi:tetratricopeptide (TPR) repeat protein